MSAFVYALKHGNVSESFLTLKKTTSSGLYKCCDEGVAPYVTGSLDSHDSMQCDLSDY